MEKGKMRLLKERLSSLSDKDLDFLIDTAAPEVSDRNRLKEILKEDEDFRERFITDEKVVQTVLYDEEIFLKISPHLFFEILLKKAKRDLSEAGYTIEKTPHMRIPVFDADEVIEFLKDEGHLFYLADMLSSFTKVESYSILIQIREGIWKRIRFNNMDIQSLRAFCDVVDEEYRFTLYKRIADLCLFILGLFPDYVERNYRYPHTLKKRPSLFGIQRLSPEEYEKEGIRFYRLAAEHQSVKDTELEELFWDFSENFQKAKKPLNYISEHYFRYSTKQRLFEIF